MRYESSTTNRRVFMAAGTLAVAAVSTVRSSTQAVATDTPTSLVVPPAGKRILLSCKLGMIAKEEAGKKLTLVERLKLAGTFQVPPACALLTIANGTRSVPATFEVPKFI